MVLDEVRFLKETFVTSTRSLVSGTAGYSPSITYIFDEVVVNSVGEVVGMCVVTTSSLAEVPGTGAEMLCALRTVCSNRVRVTYPCCSTSSIACWRIRARPMEKNRLIISVNRSDTMAMYIRTSIRVKPFCFVVKARLMVKVGEKWWLMSCQT